MKHIFLNLKRFDISCERGGVNRIASIGQWGGYIVSQTQSALAKYPEDAADFAMFFPEAHLLGAGAARKSDSRIQIGCQGVYRDDTAPGGNFGAFTTNLTANAAVELGCRYTMIGHCEERNDKKGILSQAGVVDPDAVNRILNAEIKAAQKAGLKVLYCIGETSEEQENWEQVLGAQLKTGLAEIDLGGVCIAYEPVWSIGPGKTPADKDYITKIARFVKKEAGEIPVVYGGGLKQENAQMLASIPEIDGGLIALTRFAGEIGFYPDEYLEIVDLYLSAVK